MNKRNSCVTSSFSLMIKSCFFLIAQLGLHAEANYICAVETTPGGRIDEVIFKTRREKLQCEKEYPCKCELIMVTCLIGPDSLGNF